MNPSDHELPKVLHSSLMTTWCTGSFLVVEHVEFPEIICDECKLLLIALPTAAVPFCFEMLANPRREAEMTCSKCGTLRTFPDPSEMRSLICSGCREKKVVGSMLV